MAKAVITEWTADLERLLQEFRSDTSSLRKRARKFLHAEPIQDSSGLAEVRAAVRGIYGSSISKISSSCLHVQRAIQNQDHLSYVVFSRVLVEQTAMLFGLAHKVSILFRSDANDAMYRDVACGFTKALLGTRFDWASFWKVGIAGMVRSTQTFSPKYRQTNILTWFSKWASMEPMVAVLYELLCDVVHPNVGGSMLFFNVDSGKCGFVAGRASPLGDLIVWNTFKQIRRVQFLAVEILGAFRESIQIGSGI